jgi:hypothetical protein
MLRPRPLACACFVLCLALACAENSGALIPWGGDAETGGSTEASDVADDALPPAGWGQVPLEDGAGLPILGEGEAIADWWGNTDGTSGRNVLLFVTNGARVGRLVDGAVDWYKKPAGEDAGQALETISGAPGGVTYTGIWAPSKDDIWVVGHRNDVNKNVFRKRGLWAAQVLKDEENGDWNDVWGGSSGVWFVGQEGAVLHVVLKADGGIDTRYRWYQAKQDEKWQQVTGNDSWIYMISPERVARLATTPANMPPATAVVAADLDATQVFNAIWSPDANRLFVVGAPKQILFSAGETPFTLNQQVSGLNEAYVDISGSATGSTLTVLAISEWRNVAEFMQGAWETTKLDAVPPEKKLKRVWLFPDGSAYVLAGAAPGDVFYRGPQNVIGVP